MLKKKKSERTLFHLNGFSGKEVKKKWFYSFKWNINTPFVPSHKYIHLYSVLCFVFQVCELQSCNLKVGMKVEFFGFTLTSWNVRYQSSLYATFIIHHHTTSHAPAYSRWLFSWNEHFPTLSCLMFLTFIFFLSSSNRNMF